MPAMEFDRFYRYQELSDLLHAFSTAYPNLISVHSIGKSFEGRDIWVVTLTNGQTGPAKDKPAVWIDGNIHSVEVTASTACLYHIHKMVSGFGSDRRITHCLDTRVLYMRQADANGPWKSHPEEPRLLVRRAPDDFEGDFYRLYREGEVAEFDGVMITHTIPREGLDLNRNFPANWAPEGQQIGAGTAPLSEPETRAMGSKGSDLSGYPAVSIYHDFRYHPKQDIAGGFDWVYEHLGIYFWTVEYWAPHRTAGVDMSKVKYADWLFDHDAEDDLTMFRYFDRECPGKAYVDW